MRGRIALGKGAIAGLRDHLAIAHEDAADRHLAGLRRDARLFEREVHEALRGSGHEFSLQKLVVPAQVWVAAFAGTAV